MNEELDSQLSAMFDDELPHGECELLARRLSRDEQLKARWGRYAVVGAVIRAERGVRLNAPLAGRVSAVLLAEPELTGEPAPRARAARVRWWQPLAAGALAAGVATVSVLWLRSQSGAVAPLAAQLDGARAHAPALLPATPAGTAAVSYVVPTQSVAANRPVVVPSTELANYVVAHSMFSAPVARRNLLSSFVTSESAPAVVEEAVDNAQRAAQ
jgi:negative regulator of sigma E activity